MTAKAVNYTTEQTIAMVTDYQAGVTVETIAQNLGKSVRSVVAKLSREKVYQAKTYVSKTGEPVVKKDAVADAIGAVLMLTESEIESLTKDRDGWKDELNMYTKAWARELKTLIPKTHQIDSFVLTTRKLVEEKVEDPE